MYFTIVTPIVRLTLLGVLKMATITKRTRADGSIVYKAEIVIKKDGVIIHRESKTFDKTKLAKDWSIRREVELQNTDVYAKKDYLSIGTLIDEYINLFSPEGRTKKSDLKGLRTRDICKIDVHKLTVKDLVKHIQLRNEVCKPQTAKNDLIWLSGVIQTMSGMHKLEFNMGIFDEARRILSEHGLIASSVARDRRPTKEELWELSRHFDGMNIPMLHLMWFAIYSARRQSEIMRIKWDDIRHEDRTYVVYGLKDPLKRVINKRAKMPLSAYKIIMKQPRIDERVFPYTTKTICTYFTNACRLLQIDNLHFHDLRHEATSRLFEKGLSIVDVQQITLHSSWKTLQRYCNTNPGDIDI